jgi:hypothetical protein
MNIDTRYVSGDIVKDVQFLKDNLTKDDMNMIQAQLRLIMSLGSGKIEATEENPKWTK